MMRDSRYFAFLFVLFLFVGKFAYGENPNIIIDKQNLRLYLIEETDTIMNVPVCVGTNFGNKTCEGDRKTPEGNFSISQIQNSRHWKHDFNDGAGLRKGAYGPYFLRIKMPKWTSIGIHGTCFPESIGTRDSEGCIRLLNEDLIRLKSLAHVGTKVTILPDIEL
ncbi:MAG: L,D-transpeptidase [Muribaculaceae bacterium]|nr:L,D-transpeptidase [Muribaculaceae bacterium]